MIHLRLLFLLVCLAALAACETTVKAAKETVTKTAAATEVNKAPKRSGTSIPTLETNAGSPPSQTKNSEKDAEERRLEETGSSQEKKGTETATVTLSKVVEETCSGGGTGDGGESCPTLNTKPQDTQRDGKNEKTVERKLKAANVNPEVKPDKEKSEIKPAAEKSEGRSAAEKTDVKTTAGISEVKQTKVKPEVKPTEAKPAVKPTEAKPEVKQTKVKPEVKSTEAKPEVKPTESKPEVKQTKVKPEVKSTEAKPAVKPTEAKPTVKPTEAKPEVKPTGAKPEVKQTKVKPEVKSTEAKPAVIPTEAKPAVKPTEAKPEVKATEAKPEVKQTEAKPEVKQTEAKGKVKQPDVKPKAIKSAEINLTQDKVSDIKSSNAKSEQTKAVEKAPKEKKVEGDNKMDTLQVGLNERKSTQDNHSKISPDVKLANTNRLEDNTSQAKPSEPNLSAKPPKIPSVETNLSQPKPHPKTKPSEPKLVSETKPSEPHHPSKTKPHKVLSETKSEEKNPQPTLNTKPQEMRAGKAFSKSDVNIPNVDGLDRAERPARILAVVPYNARSHFAMFGLLFRALAARGHQVDVVSHFPVTDPPDGYRDLSVNGSFPSWEDNVDLESVESLNALTDATFLWYETLDVCATVLEHPNVQKLLRSGEKYDLVISEIFGADCLAGFAYKHRAPLVGVVSSTALPWVLDRVGSPDHPAYISNYFLPFVPPMSFWQRGINALYGAAIRRLKALLCDRANDALVRRYFGEDLPSTSELVGRTSLILINSHPVSNQPRPFVPAVVEVGGLHIGEPKPLPEDLERLVSGARHGVVLFSLGTMMKLSSFPLERLSALWSALGALPQLVLLKSRDELPGAPPNVHVRTWLPQFDLLCHPNVVLFVTHGGLMGTQEAVWAGVPMLGIPLFADQRLNLRTYETKGVALLFEHHELTHDRLSHALHRLISDDRFRMNAQALSVQFRDRPSPPLRSAVWWVEYVLRHQGAPHLRSAAADMPWYQLLLLDVVAAVAAVTALAAAVVWVVLSAVYRAIRFGSARPKTRKPIVDPEGRPKRYTKTKQH